MKKIILLILAFCFLLPMIILAQQPQWYLHYYTGSVFDSFDELYFVNENYGWVVGNSHPNNGMMIMTKDGGDSWINVEDSLWYNDWIHSVFFTDTLHGWIMASSGRIYFTIDGGYDWSEIAQLDFSPTLVGSALYFKNNQEGWAVGGNIYLVSPSGQIEEGFIYHTTDGGYNWQLVNNDTTVIKKDVCFSDSLNGIIVGWYQQIYVTHDGGESWTLNDSFNSNYDFHACDNINDTTFVVVGCSVTASYDTYPLIGKSTDWGENWNFTVWQNPGVDCFFCVDFIDEQTGWFGSKNSTFCYTNDGGQSFQSTNLGLSGYITSIQMLNENLGWACAFQSNPYYGAVFKYGIPTGIKKTNETERSGSFHIYQNYPNPFNSNTKINFELFEISHISITIFNSQGENVIELMNDIKKPGKYSASWDGMGNNGELVSSGIYYARIITKHLQKTIKMLYLK